MESDTMRDAALRLADRLALPSLRQIITVLLGVGLLTLSAKIHIPAWPVPMTLQTMAVMGLAITLGPRMAPAVMLAYLAAGAAGMPVFSGTPERGLALPYMVGPTGGYLLGYLAASWLSAQLAEHRGVWGRFGAMLAGLMLVYALGAAWLAVFIPARQVFALGVLPFLPADLVKIAILALGAAALPVSLARLRGMR